MLAKRIVASISEGSLGSSAGSWAELGADVASRLAWAAAADELALGVSEDVSTGEVVAYLQSVGAVARVPVTVSMSIRTSEQIDELLRAGADRVYLQAAQAESFAAGASTRWGTQAIGLQVWLWLEDGGKSWRLTAARDRDGKALSTDWVVQATRDAAEVLVRVEQADLGECSAALRAIGEKVDVPVAVAGLIRTAEGLRRVLIEGGVSALLFEPRTVEEFEDVAQLKVYLAAAGIVVRGA